MNNATKVADDIFMVSREQGGGAIRREIWVGRDGKTSTYHLTYINQEARTDSDGLVLGVDYVNGEWSEYLMGESRQVKFSSLEEMEERFDVKWNFLPRPTTPLTGAGTPPSGVLSAEDPEEYFETKGMKLTITRGKSADFFKRGRELAARLDKGERFEPEKVVMFGSHDELCYSRLPKGEWESLRSRLVGKSM